jgi:RND superfamily putative drug exporter
MFELVSRVVSGPRSKWVVVAAWVIVAVVFGAIGSKLPDRLEAQVATVEELGADTPSAQLVDTVDKRFPGGQPFLTLVVYRRNGGIEDADRAVINRQVAAFAQVEHAGKPMPPFAGGRPVQGQVSRDGAIAFTVLPILSNDAEERSDSIDEMRDITDRHSPGLDTYVTGAAALQSDLNKALEQTDAPLIIGTGLLVLGLLIAIYRSPIIPLVPLFVVGLSFTIAQGVLYLLAGATDTTIDRTATSLLAILMFGAGTDYCLLMVARYTSNLRRHADRHDAMRASVPEAAPAIVASGSTVAGALLLLLFANVETTQIFGPVNAIGIVIVLIASITLLPAMLAILGRRGFWPSRAAVALDPRFDVSQRAVSIYGVIGTRESAWGRLSQRLLRRPVLAMLASLTLLAVGTLGLLTYKEDVNQVNQFRKDAESTEGFDVLRSGFPAGALFPTTVLVDRSSGPAGAADVAAVRHRLEGVDGIAAVAGPTGRSRDGRAITLQLTYADDPYGDAALERTRHIRTLLADLGGSRRAIVGDGTAERVDYLDAAGGDQTRIVPLVLALIFLMLVALLRSLVAPLYLLATVILSFFASLGISLVAFDLLGMDTVDPAYPLLAFVFLVALGIDYNIFLMDSVREGAPRYRTREAIVRALAITGSVITSAGLILAGTFGLLATLPLEVLFQLGFTVALGVLIDTFIVRTILVPSITWLIGDRVWWPSKLARVQEGMAATASSANRPARTRSAGM